MLISLVFLTAGLAATTIILPKNKIWPVIILQANVAFLLSAISLNSNLSNLNWNSLSWSLGIDNLSSPLILLSFWLLPASLLASINHLATGSSENNKTFIIMSLIILTALLITFSSLDLIVLFIGFEATLVPTLILISRWGNQQERIEAGYYFVFYTLISSLPLFISLLVLYNTENTLSIPLLNLLQIQEYYNILPTFCLIAFLVKVPIFGVHLWLPKAHVEAPVAGSMILAAILLKLGGYGFIRLTNIFQLTFIKSMAPTLIPYCCWGGLLTSLICLSQTDLKSLIAYSSVSHMSFMIAGISSMTPWGINGGIIMMIAHGIASSALFSIANIYYERTGTRTLSINRGIKSAILMLPLFWLIFSCANLALPPLPNSMAEVLLFVSLLNFSIFAMFTVVGALAFTAIFSLTVFQLLNSGTDFSWNQEQTSISEREYLMLLYHLIPLLSLILLPNIMTL